MSHTSQNDGADDDAIAHHAQGPTEWHFSESSFAFFTSKLFAPPAGVLELALVHLTLRLNAQATDANEVRPVFRHSCMECDLVWRPK